MLPHQLAIGRYRQQIDLDPSTNSTLSKQMWINLYGAGLKMQASCLIGIATPLGRSSLIFSILKNFATLEKVLIVLAIFSVVYC